MDNILHNYRLNKALKLNAKVKERAQDLASSVGIKHLLKRKPKQLSQGECQRVAICRALLSSPQLILADEATGNLDPESKKNVLDILLKYTKEHKAVLVAVTHDHELLDSFDKTFDFKKFRQSK
jgi:putative ABC transport system ATP-binding protein